MSVSIDNQIRDCVTAHANNIQQLTNEIATVFKLSFTCEFSCEFSAVIYEGLCPVPGYKFNARIHPR